MMNTDYLLGNKGAHIYNGNVYQCERCGKTYKKRACLQKHRCNICGLCDKIFQTAQKLKLHTCATTLSCDKCKKHYKSTKTLSSHKCTYCKHCSSIFSSFKKLNQHLQQNNIPAGLTKQSGVTTLPKETQNKSSRKKLFNSDIEMKENNHKLDKNSAINEQDTQNSQTVETIDFSKECSQNSNHIHAMNKIKNISQTVKTKTIANDELIYKYTQQRQNFTFNPIDMTC